MFQHCNKYQRTCPECQQLTLNEPQYVILHLLILQFPMAFISLDLYRLYHETENGNQYALTIICMLTNWSFVEKTSDARPQT